MPDYFDTDMSHMEAALSPGMSVPAAAWRFATYLGDIVRTATALEPGGLVHSALPCRRRPGRKPCPGRLMVYRCEVPPEIHWKCPSCEESGVITGWRGTRWDFGSKSLAPPEYPDDPDAEAHLSAENYRMLRKHVVTASLEEDQIVAGAQMNPDGPPSDAIVVCGPPEFMEELLGSVAAAANHVPSRYLQRRLDALYDRISGAIEA